MKIIALGIILILLLVAISFKPIREATIDQVEYLTCNGPIDCIEQIFNVSILKQTKIIQIDFTDRTGKFLGVQTPITLTKNRAGFTADITLKNINKKDEMVCLYNYDKVPKLEVGNKIKVHFLDRNAFFLLNQLRPTKTWRGYAGMIYDEYTFDRIVIKDNTAKLTFTTSVLKNDTSAYIRCWISQGSPFQISFYPGFKLDNYDGS